MRTRALSAEQRALVDFLLSRDFPSRDALAVQAITVRTAGLTCNCGCPSFSLVPDTSLPSANVPDPPVVSDAHGTDPEGNAVGVLLFVDWDGYLSEVEIYPADQDVGGIPDPSELRFSEWSDPNDRGTRFLLNP